MDGQTDRARWLSRSAPRSRREWKRPNNSSRGAYLFSMLEWMVSRREGVKPSDNPEKNEKQRNVQRIMLYTNQPTDIYSKRKARKILLARLYICIISHLWPIRLFLRPRIKRTLRQRYIHAGPSFASQMWTIRWLIDLEFLVIKAGERAKNKKGSTSDIVDSHKKISHGQKCNKQEQAKYFIFVRKWQKNPVDLLHGSDRNNFPPSGKINVLLLDIAMTAKVVPASDWGVKES